MDCDSPVLVDSSFSAGADEGSGKQARETFTKKVRPVLYGSSNSRTHNYPLVLADGNKLGLKHGPFRTFGEKTPLSNLFVTMLNRLDVPGESFADSTGEMSELLG